MPRVDIQDTLFEIEPHPPMHVEDIDQTLPLEEFAQQIALVRRQNIEAHEAQIGATKTPLEVSNADSNSEPKPERKPSPMKGGAFVSGLKRFRQTVSDEVLQESHTKHDLALLEPQSIKRQLTPTGEELTYNGILFTPQEYSRITLSPEALSKRVGAKVLNHTIGRLPSARIARKTEVQQQAIGNRAEAASIALGDLHQDLTLAVALEAEAALPRLAHMTADKMDDLVESMSTRFAAMLEAILLNHGITDDKRVEALQTAFMYLLAQEDDSRSGTYKATKYWHDLSKVYIKWTEQKIACFESIQEKVNAKLADT